MAKKEKITIHRDKTLEPIDIELDAAMGQLDDANKHINDLLTSLDPAGLPAAGDVAATTADAAPVVYAEMNEDGEPAGDAVETPSLPSTAEEGETRAEGETA